MAFDITSQASKYVQAHLTSIQGCFGVVALAGGVATVTVPQMTEVICAFVSPQSSNATTVSAVTGNTFSIAGTGTDNVMWFALGRTRE